MSTHIDEEIILIGQPESKRTTFFHQAAQQQKLVVHLIEPHQINEQQLATKYIKIDPPIHQQSALYYLPDFYHDYQRQLTQIAETQGARFLNSPNTILTFLDKIATKQQLNANNLPTPHVMATDIPDIDALHELMRYTGHWHVFIKPNYGSGASGVMAYHYHPSHRYHRLYTSCSLINGLLYNTKTLRKLTAPSMITPLLNQLFQQPTLVEMWVPKHRYQHYQYDLRIIWQFGQIDYHLVRLSKGPITNLHLNNSPLAFNALGLSLSTREAIANLCQQTSQCFPEANVMALDILIDDQQQPWVIEINGQGDLIYQDIYTDNIIYHRQLQNRMKWRDATN